MSKKTKLTKPEQQTGQGNRGRPYDVNDRVKASIIALCRQGLTDKEIANELGISPRTLANWKGDSLDLMQSMHNAKAVADELVEMSLFKRAVGYTYKAIKLFQHEGEIITKEYEEHVAPDVRAAELWLRNRKPEQWREKKEVEISGSLNLEDLITKAFSEEKKETQ